MGLFQKIILATALAIVAVTFAHASAETNSIIRCAGDLYRAKYENWQGPTNFDFEATVTVSNVETDSLYVFDSTGVIRTALMGDVKGRRFEAGDVVRIRGNTRYVPAYDCRFADVYEADLISHGSPPEPMPVTLTQILSGKFRDRLVRVEGTVLDAFCDEIDPNFAFFVLVDGPETFYFSFRMSDEKVDFSRYIGAFVSVTGICEFNDKFGRAKVGYQMYLLSSDNIKIINPAPVDPYAVPELHGTLLEVQNLSFGPMRRGKTKGWVAAVWSGGNLLVDSGNGKVSRIELSGGKVPGYGDYIEAVGIVETDLHHFNLSRAIWRPVKNSYIWGPKAEHVTAEYMLTDGNGHSKIKMQYHGRPVILTGFVRNLSAKGNTQGRFYLESDGNLIPVDYSSCPSAVSGLENGCRVDVTGTCVMDIENWRPQLPFPHVRGFMLVLRKPGDITVVTRAPWWTVRRLFSVIGLLSLALIGISVWNWFLRRISDTKVRERTRLAVELHDAISQNLTAVALEVNTADAVASEDLPEARSHLHLAARTLKSCREELRNCLWDLRNNALDESDMNEAIRQTLTPQIGNAKLNVRFNVARSRFADNTAHAVLHIIRELAVNAIRHGKATALRIAGSIENGRLLFSVKDDGIGFDTSSVPGVEEGHFGIQGIRERVKGFSGSVEIESSPGKGTKVSIALTLPSKKGKQ